MTWEKCFDLVKDEVGNRVRDWFYAKVDSLFLHVKQTNTPSKDMCITCSILTLKKKVG